MVRPEIVEHTQCYSAVVNAAADRLYFMAERIGWERIPESARDIQRVAAETEMHGRAALEEAMRLLQAAEGLKILATQLVDEATDE